MGDLGGFPTPFTGRVNVKFVDFKSYPKENDENGKTWLKLNFADESGNKAGWDGNLFPGTEKSGRQTSNHITMRGIGELFAAAGLDPSSIDDSIEEITKCLDSLKGELTVSADITVGESGYNEASKFQKSK